MQNFEDFSIPEQFRKIYFNKLGEADIKIKFAQQPDFNSSIKKLSEEIKDLINNNYQGPIVSECRNIEAHKAARIFEKYFDDNLVV